MPFSLLTYITSLTPNKSSPSYYFRGLSIGYIVCSNRRESFVSTKRLRLATRCSAVYANTYGLRPSGALVSKRVSREFRCYSFVGAYDETSGSG